MSADSGTAQIESLTPKQEAFARAYVETGNASEAYRRAYDAEAMTREAIQVEASRLKDHPIVALLIENLQFEHRKRHAVTVESITRELDEARSLALADPKGAAAAISASMGKAKLHGLLVDKQEHAGPGGGAIPVAGEIKFTFVKPGDAS